MNLNIKGKQAKEYFASLEEEKDSIELELGEPLNWRLRPEKRSSIIELSMQNLSLENKADWPRMFEWFYQKTNNMHQVFSKRIKFIDLKSEIEDEIPELQ